MPQTLISEIFSMLSICEHADLSSVSRLLNQVSAFPTSSYGSYSCCSFIPSSRHHNVICYSSHVLNWSNKTAAKPSHELGRQLRRHIRTRSVIIKAKLCNQRSWK
jgi:hypothetical protein